MTGRIFWAALACTTAVLFLARDASAGGGFQIQEGGPSHGNAGAGGAATANDPSTVFFNPAGMMGIRGNQGAIIVKAIDFSIRYRDAGSRDLTGGRIRGGNGRNGGVTSVVPSFYAVLDGGDDVRYGIGVNAPFGLDTDYGDTWAGRYHATRSSVRVINVNPAIAWRLSEQWSVGAGVNLQHVEVILENAIDFGSIGVDSLGKRPAGQPGLRPQKDDGRVEITGDSFGVGWNAGVLYEPQPGTRFGLSWRSSVSHRLDGDADFDVPRDARRLTAAGDFRDNDVKADLTLPQSVLFGVSHDVSPKWTVVGGVEWTDWSQFRQIKVEFDHPKQEDLIQRQNWTDTTRSMLGVIWSPCDRWTLRAGIAHDSSPVGTRNRRPRLPDSSRNTIAIGLRYQLSKRSAIDIGYMRAWTDRQSLDITDEGAGRLRGSTRNGVNFLGVTFTASF